MIMMMYLLFSAGLYLWTTKAITYASSIPLTEYRAGIVLLVIFLVIVRIADRSRKLYGGVAIACILMNLGLSVDYAAFDRVHDPEKITELFQEAYARDLMYMLAAFCIVFLLIRYTSIYRSRILNIAAMVLLPVAFAAARFKDPVGGAYLTVFGILVFSVLLFSYPFIAAYWLSKDENVYFSGDVMKISLNLLSLLAYTFCMYAGCMLINEFGALLIVAITSSLLFLSNCRDKFTKFLYMAAAFGGAVLAAMTASHVKNRIIVWLDPIKAANNGLEETAESVLFVFRHINNTGWWGNGIGALSEKYFTSLHNDHVLLLLGYDYSLVLCVFVILLTVLLVGWMLRTPAGICAYDRYLNLSCALIMGCLVLVNLGSVSGSFLTCGVPYPFISDGGSTNMILTAFLAIHCAIIKKGEAINRA